MKKSIFDTIFLSIAFAMLSLFMVQGQNATATITVEQLQQPRAKDANNFVLNPNAIINEQTVAQINAMAQKIETEKNAQIAVVVLQTIGNAEIKDFATRLFEHWKVGKAGVDNGVLVLFVADQKLITIEVGYGLEGALNDAISKRIINQYFVPAFKQGDFDKGFIDGITAISKVIFEEETMIVAEKPFPWDEVLPMAIGLYLLLITVSFVWVNAAIKKVLSNPIFKANIDRYKAIRDQKNGIMALMAVGLPIILFVVAYFLGLSIHYFLLIVPVFFCFIPANILARIAMHKARRAPMVCNECGGKMNLLSEKHEDVHLTIKQQFEEELQSVDYDIFECEDCKNEAVFTLDKPSQYSECPKCKTKAFILHDKRTIVHATYVSGGVERTTYKCKFCGYEEHNNKNTPRLQRNNAVIAGGAAGSVFSGRGGFGGGGGFSGGSFGGGRSGGGGATGGW